jgi:hypothetical protein
VEFRLTSESMGRSAHIRSASGSVTVDQVRCVTQAIASRPLRLDPTYAQLSSTRAFLFFSTIPPGKLQLN